MELDTIRQEVIEATQKRVAEMPISKAELARRAKVPPGYITRISRGLGTGISLDRLVTIAQAVGLTVELTATEATPPTPPQQNPDEVF